jgi:cobalt-precorrin-5B (C1)-methyltransferase
MQAPDPLIEAAGQANTANEVLTLAASASLPLGEAVAAGARKSAIRILQNADITVGVLVVDRAGNIVGEAG